MAWLHLSPGRKVMVSATFEHPDDEYVRMAMNPEARAHLGESVDSEVIDQEMGLTPTAIAQLTIFTKQAIGEDRVVFMTKDELRLHVYQCMAVLKSLDGFEESVDRVMRDYRQKLVKGDGGEDS